MEKCKTRGGSDNEGENEGERKKEKGKTFEGNNQKTGRFVTKDTLPRA